MLAITPYPILRVVSTYLHKWELTPQLQVHPGY